MTESIDYKGKNYPVKIGYYAMKKAGDELKQTTGQELTLDSIMSAGIEVLEPVLYYGLVMGHELEGKELDLPREKMEFVLDACLPQVMALIKNNELSKELLGKFGGGMVLNQTPEPAPPEQ